MNQAPVDEPESAEPARQHAPPRVTGPTVDDDLDAIQPTPMSRAGGALLAATGGFTVVLSLQTWLLVVRVPAVVKVLVVVMTLLGPAQVYLGWKITRLHGWAATMGTACGGAGALVSFVWAGYALLHGVFSVLSFLLVPLSILAAIIAGACIARGRVADEARARLAKHGMEVGT
jgi:hypothetical protein